MSNDGSGYSGKSLGGTGLNNSQRLFMLTRFSRIDELLQAIARLSDSNSSPFSRYKADFPPEQAAHLAAIAAEVREKMLATLDELHIVLPEPDLSSKWTVQTSLTFIDVALAGMSEKALHGYGEVDGEAAQRMSEAVADIKRLVDDARRLVKPAAPRE
jgi:hypothetical protein